MSVHGNMNYFIRMNDLVIDIEIQKMDWNTTDMYVCILCWMRHSNQFIGFDKIRFDKVPINNLR